MYKVDYRGAAAPKNAKQSENQPRIIVFLLGWLIAKTAALRNHMRIVFEEMSSWTALTMYLGMKTTFYTKYI